MLCATRVAIRNSVVCCVVLCCVEVVLYSVVCCVVLCCVVLCCVVLCCVVLWCVVLCCVVFCCVVLLYAARVAIRKSQTGVVKLFDVLNKTKVCCVVLCCVVLCCVVLCCVVLCCVVLCCGVVLCCVDAVMLRLNFYYIYFLVTVVLRLFLNKRIVLCT